MISMFLLPNVEGTCQLLQQEKMIVTDVLRESIRSKNSIISMIMGLSRLLACYAEVMSAKASMLEMDKLI